MCFADLLVELRRRGIQTSEAKIRWVIRTGKVPKPPLDGSKRYRFDAALIEKLANALTQKQSKKSAKASNCLETCVATTE